VQLYRRRTAELSLADCVLFASLEEDDALATSDRPLARAARRLGHDVIALPDSPGDDPKRADVPLVFRSQGNELEH
jgi:hypothetical protein